MPSDPVPSDAALADVRALFARRQAEDLAPSVVYGVLADGRVVDCGGFGTVDGRGTVPGADTAYRIASVTKSFTASALVLLRDRGALALDAPITDFVPAAAGIRMPTPDSPVPTLRMLATMSSGLPNDDPWADRQEALTDDRFDAVLRAGVRCAWVPGTEYEYSNLGFALLGRAIQVADGRRYRDVVADELITPLGLTGTGFTRDVPATGGVAIGHERIGGEWATIPFSGPGAFSPIGGLFSTVNDLVRWMQFFVDAHRGRTAGPLSAVSRREMQQGARMITPEPERTASHEASSAYGFGLVVAHDVDHGTVVSHSGGYPGFSAHIRWHPASGVGIVALENATYAGVGRQAAEALRVLLATLTPVRQWRPWPETMAALAAVTGLLRGWDDSVAARLFSDNVVLDEPFERRRTAIAAVLSHAGALGDVDDEHSDGPNNCSWRIHGQLADVRCTLTMNPQDPPRVQSLVVGLDPTATAGPDGVTMPSAGLTSCSTTTAAREPSQQRRRTTSTAREPATKRTRRSAPQTDPAVSGP